MTKPIVSVIVPTIRTSNWDVLLDSLSNNDIEYEVIFVGPEDNKKKLESNVRFIRTAVKPNQCIHIGILLSKGEYVINTADDYVFSNNALDLLYKGLKSIGEDNHAVIGKFAAGIVSEDGIIEVSQRKRRHMGFFGRYSGGYLKKNMYCPIIANGESILYKKDHYLRLGGYDSRFISCYGDIDFCMRLLENDIKIEIVRGVKFIEVSESSIISGDQSNQDCALFYSLWCRYNDSLERYGPDRLINIDKKKIKKQLVVACKNRSIPIIPFNNENLLEISQGPKGKWI